MTNLKLALRILTLVSLPLASQAWWIDPVSCKSGSIEQLALQEAATEASAMIRQSTSEFEKFGTASENPSIRQLAAHILGDATQIDIAHQFFNRLNTNPEAMAQSNWQDGILLYCDISRWKRVQRNGKDIVRDIDNSINFKEGLDAINECTIPKANGNVAVALTYVDTRVMKSIIQICPTNLLKYAKARFPTADEWIQNMLQGPPTDFKVDVLRLADHAVLHEVCGQFILEKSKNHLRLMENSSSIHGKLHIIPIRVG
jgi:hypothetical protein